VEERELCVFFLADLSASAAFGSGAMFKSETIAEFCALLGLSAATNNDRVGMILFSDRIDRHIPPRKGMQHGLRIVRELLSHEPSSRGGTDIHGALQYLVRVRRRRAIVFLISDFLDQGFEKSLERAAKRHDLIAVRVGDPRERALDGHGVLRLRDLESGREGLVDLGNRRLAEEYARAASERTESLKRLLASVGVDFLDIETGTPMAGPLRAFFLDRIRRRVRA
jgi:uncharacterized protein (DUF58 family)